MRWFLYLIAACLAFVLVTTLPACGPSIVVSDVFPYVHYVCMSTNDLPVISPFIPGSCEYSAANRLAVEEYFLSPTPAATPAATK